MVTTMCHGDAAPPASPPFPYYQAYLLGLISLLNTISLLATLPLVPFMILAFFPELPRADIGFWSGILEGAYNVGAFFGAFWWGWFADRFGRRPALLLGLVGTAGSCALFGLAPNFATAVLARFLWGILNGNVGVAKTCLSELCSDDQQARAFSVLSVQAGVGRLLGPAFGGLLSEPARKYGWSSPLFVAFPFALPSIVISALALLVSSVGYFVLTETRKTEGSGNAYARIDGSAPETCDGAPAVPPLSSNKSISVDVSGDGAVTEISEDLDDNLDDNLDDDDDLESSDGSSTATLSPPPALGSAATHPPQQQAAVERSVLPTIVSDYVDVWRDTTVRVSVLIYTWLGLVALIGQELLPLMLVLDRSAGGFALDSSGLGLLSLASAPALIIFTALCYAPLISRMGLLRVQSVFLVGFGAILAVTPALALAARALDAERAKWAVLVAYTSVTMVVRNIAFTASFQIVGNAARDEERARVNGLGQAFVSIARAFGPPLATPAFAAALATADGASSAAAVAVWLVLAVGAVAVVHLVWKLPQSVEKKRVG